MKNKTYIYIIALHLCTVYMLSSAVAESIAPSKIMYYGANIGQFPPEIRNWITDKGFPKEKMEKDSMKDPKLKAWWSDDGNTVLFEASYTIAKGYKIDLLGK